MKLVFTKSYEDLAQSLESIGGQWDVSQPNKKVLRSDDGIMNWYESTGTIQFQGREDRRILLEAKVRNLLYPEEFQSGTPQEAVQKSQESEIPPFESQSEVSISEQYLDGDFDCSELIIGIVSAVGTETTRVVTPLRDRLSRFGYTVKEIKVSSLLTATSTHNEYERIRQLMAAGDKLREEKQNNAILAYGASKLVRKNRSSNGQKTAYVINSLKHPDEVEVLRKIYGQGFYLFGIHTDKKRRLHYLMNDKGLTTTQANELTAIDEDEKIPHGQRTRDTYHLADFFVNFGKNDDQVKNAIQRFLELIFSQPFKNPTFDEFSMFMAFSSSVRSGDLSRQVGAVIANNKQIMATGANECPASGGGLYWAEVDKSSGEVLDTSAGKDYMRGEDSNKAEQNEIMQEILQGVRLIDSIPEGAMCEIESELKKSRISDLTEFGRVVHAEMEAIISCARAGINCVGATLYCTTFPCHNCAKHIIAAGISRVIYVEPYPKSKALEFHSDSIELRTRLDDNTQSAQVIFEPFTGVGARRFLDFFSMNLGIGNKLKRKNKDGSAVSWSIEEAHLRVALLPKSYLEVEEAAAKMFDLSTSGA
jgi:deoxycytidylate deaminase